MQAPWGQKPTQSYWESAQFVGTRTFRSGQKEAQHKDTESLCGRAGDGESGPGRFLIGLELKLRGGGGGTTLLWFKERG